MMTDIKLLNNIDHHDLGYAPQHGAAFGDAVNLMMLVPTEFEDAQREYPILFRRDEDGAIQAVVLLGLDRGENLFLGNGAWRTRYIPAVQRRGPFTIGMQASPTGGADEPMIHVDLADPRIARGAGMPLFLPHGGNAPALDHVADALGALHEGLASAAALYAAWDQFGLLQPAEIAVTVGEGTRYDLPGFLSVSEERLAALSADALGTLHARGQLRLAFLVAASLGNFARLIALKNRKLAGG